MKPEILILDEPTAGLDPASKKEILERIRKYQEDRKVTIIIVSHDADIVAAYTKKVLILENGRIAKYDTVDKIFSEGESLEQFGIEIPKIVKIFCELKKKGLELNTNIYTVEQGKEEIVSAITLLKNKKKGV